MAESRTGAPSEAELNQLPRWARVAFAARCARRVEWFFVRFWRGGPANIAMAVKSAIEFAEESARRGQFAVPLGSASSLEQAAVVHDDIDHAIEATQAATTGDKEAGATAAAMAASAAGRAAAVSHNASLSTRAAFNASAAAVVVVQKQVAVNLAGYYRQQSEMPNGEGNWQIEAEPSKIDAARSRMRMDFELLLKLACAEAWTDDTPVFPELCGALDEEADFPGASCFISYSTRDEGFVQTLFNRLKKDKVRVWYAPPEMMGGAKIREQIRQGIKAHDRLILVLSEHSMRSRWVQEELQQACLREAEERKQVLYPIRLIGMEAIDMWSAPDSVTGRDLAAEVREYYIQDFSRWGQPELFELAAVRLLAALRMSGK